MKNRLYKIPHVLIIDFLLKTFVLYFFYYSYKTQLFLSVFENNYDYEMCMGMFNTNYLRIECLILSVYWSINVRWRVTNCVNLRSEAEQVYA